MKVFAWVMTGSHSMFSEAIHSLADTLNQVSACQDIGEYGNRNESSMPTIYLERFKIPTYYIVHNYYRFALSTLKISKIVCIGLCFSVKGLGISILVPIEYIENQLILKII